MASEKMDKYLQKKPKYTEVETIDKVYSKSLDKADKDQKKNQKKIAKMLIRDDGDEKVGGRIQMVESEDGVMTYFTGQGNYHQAIRYGSKIALSRRTRQHNLQFAREILAAEGMLTPEIEEGIKKGMESMNEMKGARSFGGAMARTHGSTKMECMECGHKFKKKLTKNTVEVKCPKCKGYDTDVA